MKQVALFLALALVGCNMDVPLPDRCRAVGVDVAYDDIITGTIIEENIGTLKEVSAQCRSPFKDKYGCAIAIAPREYVLWYVDDPYQRDHERCHALYEERRHN